MNKSRMVLQFQEEQQLFQQRDTFSHDDHGVGDLGRIGQQQIQSKAAEGSQQNFHRKDSFQHKIREGGFSVSVLACV